MNTVKAPHREADVRGLRILISNDDGIYAPGLNILAAALRTLGEVRVCAPRSDQSASSHSLTLSRPLRIRRHDRNVYSVDGTPTDCVTLAFNEIWRKRPPHIVIAGLNHGANMGDDVTYSGTIAAAMEGAIMGVPAIAASVTNGHEEKRTLLSAAKFIRRLVPQVVDRLPSQTLLSVNFPRMPRGGYRRLKLTPLGRRVYTDIIQTNCDPRGKKYYWIGGEPSWDRTGDTDAAVVGKGYVSITPLNIDLTDRALLEQMRTWRLG